MTPNTVRRAFRGPNGWYMATEDQTGTHYQPSDGGRYESRAEAEAADARRYDDDTDDDDDDDDEAARA